MFGCLGQLLELQNKSSSGSSTQAGSSVGKTAADSQNSNRTTGPAPSTGLKDSGSRKREEADNGSEDDVMSDGSDTNSSSEAVSEEPEEETEAEHQKMLHKDRHDTHTAQHELGDWINDDDDDATLHAGKGAHLERLVGDLKLMLSKPWGFQAGNGSRAGR